MFTKLVSHVACLSSAFNHANVLKRRARDSQCDPARHHHSHTCSHKARVATRLQVTTEEQRDAFRAQLNDAEDWLYMDAEAEKGNADTFRSKLRTLTDLGDPIKVRAYEAARRSDRVGGAKNLIAAVKKAAKDWSKERPWLNTTHVQKLADLVR